MKVWSKNTTLAAMHMWRKKRWWVAQKDRQSSEDLRCFGAPGGPPEELPACSAAYKNSRRSWFHILAELLYWLRTGSSSSASTTSNSAPENTKCLLNKVVVYWNLRLLGTWND